MELVRNNTKDGSCKYALIRLDKMRKDGTFKNIEEFLKLYPELKEYIEFGEPHSEEEFFVIKLKDINSTRALVNYALEADKTDQEFGLQVMDLVLRSGKRHHKCKQPDLLQANNPFENFNKPNIPFFSPPDGRYLMFGDNKRNHNRKKPINLENSEVIKNTVEVKDPIVQNEKVSEIYDKLLQQQHEWEHIIPDPPQPPKGPECQYSVEDYYAPMPDEEELIRQGLKIKQPGFFEGMRLTFKSLFK